jgi:hypothetical protein
MKRTAHGRRKVPCRGSELLLFVIASVIGIYSLGQGLQGMFIPGQAVSLLWLAGAGVAMWILFAQMARVKDMWPSRLDAAQDQQSISDETE